jgi:glycosyltransferase involved in cell wall biosynthesis
MKVSVVTAVWNAKETIETAIDSIRSQCYQNIEHIVIDGGSTDGTCEVLERRRSELDVLVSEPDHGIYDALNKGVLRATGDVVGFLHADDIYAGPRSVQTIADAFTDPSIDAVYGDLLYVRRSDTSRVVRCWRAGPATPRSLKWGWMPPHPTLYVRRHRLASVGLFDTRYRIAADYDMILKLMSASDFRACYIPEVLIRMRVGGVSNRSLRHVLRKSAEDYRALRRNGVGGIIALTLKNVRKVHQFWANDR